MPEDAANNPYPIHSTDAKLVPFQDAANGIVEICGELWVSTREQANALLARFAEDYDTGKYDDPKDATPADQRTQWYLTIKESIVAPAAKCGKCSNQRNK